MAKQGQFALVSEGQVLGVYPSAREAYEAGSGSGAARKNPYIPIPPRIMDMDELWGIAEQPVAAGPFRAAGIPQVSGQQVLELTHGLEDLTEVYERLYPYFEYLGFAAHKNPNRFIRGILTGNEKTNKTREGVDAAILGLTLVPHWRNVQAGMVRNTPMNQSGFLKQMDLLDVSDDAQQVPNWCVGSSWACRRACLVATGNHYQERNFRIKFAKAEALLNDPVAFCAALAMNIRLLPASTIIRLNMLSDIPWETVFPDMFAMFPKTQFYDYTKLDVSRRRVPRNYDLTFSYNGRNEIACRHALESGHRVAVVFVAGDPSWSPTPSGRRITAAEVMDVFGKSVDRPFNSGLKRVPLVDANSDDFRALDPAPAICVLSYKQPGGVPADVEMRIRYESKFATIVPVRELDGSWSVLSTAHTPDQSPFLPTDV